MPRVPFSLTDEAKADLEAVAKECGASMQQILERIVSPRVKRLRQKLEAGEYERDGLGRAIVPDLDLDK